MILRLEQAVPYELMPHVKPLEGPPRLAVELALKEELCVHRASMRKCQRCNPEQAERDPWDDVKVTSCWQGGARASLSGLARPGLLFGAEVLGVVASDGEHGPWRGILRGGARTRLMSEWFRDRDEAAKWVMAKLRELVES